MRTPFKALLGVLFGLFLFSMISLMGGDHAKAQTWAAPAVAAVQFLHHPDHAL